MKKLIFCIFILFFNTNLLIAGCEDSFAIPLAEQQIEASLQAAENSVAQVIRQIENKIKRSHETLEADSKTILENTRNLNRQYYVVSQNILHNQILINELQSLVAEAIASSAEIKRSKNNLEIIKQGIIK